MSHDEHDENHSDADSEAQSPPADILERDDRPLGDTEQAHDEISPHDFPLGHPGRQAAEDQSGGNEGTTQGNEDPSHAPPDSARS